MPALFDSKVIEIGTSPVPCFAGFTRRGKAYCSVASHPDNTGVIYVGASANVTADTESTGGFPLRPGQARRYRVTPDIDGRTEEQIHAVSTDAGQKLYVEVGDSLAGRSMALPFIRRARFLPNQQSDPMVDAPIGEVAPPLPSHLFKDEFSSGDATSPRTCTPGPGSITLAGSRFSIASNHLEWTAGNSGGWTTDYAVGDALDRVNGRVLLGKFSWASGTGNNNIGWLSTSSPSGNTTEHSFYKNNAALAIREAAQSQNFENFTTGEVYEFAIVLRTQGAFYFIKSPVQYPQWTLIFIADANQNASLRPVIMNHSAAGTMDDWRVAYPTWTPTPSYEGESLNDAALTGGISLNSLGLSDFIVDFDVQASGANTDNYLVFTFRQNGVQFWNLFIYHDGSVALKKVGINPPTTLTATASSSRRTIRLAVYGNNTMRLYAHAAGSATWSAAANNGANFADYATNTDMALSATGSMANLTIHSVKVWPRYWADFSLGM